MEAAAAERFLGQVVGWTRNRKDVLGILLVGSWARGSARADSDLDLVLLVENAQFHVEAGAPEPATVRSSTQALVLRDRHVLVVVKRDEQGEPYVLPGGGQEFGETLEQAVARECREELGAWVRVEGLLTVREFISDHHPTSTEPHGVHVVNHAFACTLLDEPRPGHASDPGQMDVLPLEELPRLRFFPQRLAELLAKGLEVPSYLGDVN